MVIVKLFILLLALQSVAFGASDIVNAFKRKDYHTITEIFKAAPNDTYSRQELILISYSLRQMDFYRQDIKLNVRLINQKFKDRHTSILASIRDGESIDGDKYPEALKVLYWNLLVDFGQIILGYEEKSPKFLSDRHFFNTFSKILSELEFREGKVDKLNDQVLAHLEYIDKKVYKWSRSFSLSYVSWQSEARLNGQGQDIGLLVTNKGFCAGGDVGMENYLFHFYVDGCLLAGSGGIQALPNKSEIDYQQSNVPAYGFKISPGASMIVSSSKSRIGFRIPIIYSQQNLDDPPSEKGYEALNEAPVSVITSLYSRWQFNRWYFQTEFGKYISKESTFWGLGLGYTY
jgi:hypothetical protein